MNSNHLKLLALLMKNSRKSDRDCAKELGVSQPTVTRMRHQLEKEIITRYTLVPDFSKLGYDFVAFTFIRVRGLRAEETQEFQKRGPEWLAAQPEIIFAAIGEGLGLRTVLISIHKNFSCYHQLLTGIRSEWPDSIEDVQSYIVSLQEKELKELSLSSLILWALEKPNTECRPPITSISERRKRKFYSKAQ